MNYCMLHVHFWKWIALFKQNLPDQNESMKWKLIGKNGNSNEWNGMSIYSTVFSDICHVTWVLNSIHGKNQLDIDHVAINSIKWKNGLNWYKSKWTSSCVNIWLVDGSHVTYAINIGVPPLSLLGPCHHNVHIVKEVELKPIQATAHVCQHFVCTYFFHSWTVILKFDAEYNICILLCYNIKSEIV